MNDSSAPDHRPSTGIDQISTRWTSIHDPAKFVMRYAPAIRGYLAVFLKNPHDVDDVCQAFLVRVFERGIVNPDELRGRFRDYLIAAVRNAALAHLRRQRANAPTGLPVEELASPEPMAFPSDDEWVSRWRRAMLAGIWDALEKHEREHPGNLAHSVLRTLVDHPDEDSTQLAARVSQTCGRTLQPEAFRKQVSRARRLFAEFLVAEIARTLVDPTPPNIEEELIEIGLMKYVEPFLSADWRTRGQLRDMD